MSLTLDGWFAHNLLLYMGIIVYFIDLEWKLHKIVLSFEHIYNRHNGTSLADLLAIIIRYYHLEDRIYALTTDNASNISKLFENILTEY